MTAIASTTLAPITQDRVRLVADALDDHNRIHFDADFAKASGLPSTIVHGCLTAALAADVLVAQVGADRLLNLDVRLRAPVFPGDELTVEATEYGVSVSKADGTVVATGVVITAGGEDA